MKKLGLTFVFTLLLLSGNAFAQGGADRILGVYKVVGEKTKITSHIRFSKCGDSYDAHVIWVDKATDENGTPLTDALNPNPKLRAVCIDKVQVIKGVRYNPGKDEWTGGTVYNPADGKTYDVVISFDNPQKLKVRGYIGKPMIGKDFIWERLK